MDTKVIDNIIQDENGDIKNNKENENDEHKTSTLFQQINQEIIWQKMYHSGNPVARLVSVQGTFSPQECHEYYPLYRKPIDIQPIIRLFHI